jgi:hypothetical protein
MGVAYPFPGEGRVFGRSRMMPRLPMNVPRCGIATIPPNGVTRFWGICNHRTSPVRPRPLTLLHARAFYNFL